MDGDELFIAMEFMEGGDLTDLVLTVISNFQILKVFLKSNI